MPLKKPPLAEVWMSFRFEPAADSPPWDRDRYKLFLDSIAETHPNTEEMVRRGVQVTVSRRGGTPKVKELREQVLAVRARTEDSLRTVQLSPDELVANYLRGASEPYPGFAVLLEEAIAHCQRYAECYQPIGVLEAALHYVDLVDIPVSEGSILRSEEYLTLDFRVPEEIFGHFSSFEIMAIVHPGGVAEPVQLVFTSMPAQTGAGHRRFRLEWHTPIGNGSRMTELQVLAGLKTAHERLEKCFRHAFTAKGWALFEPEIS